MLAVSAVERWQGWQFALTSLAELAGSTDAGGAHSVRQSVLVVRVQKTAETIKSSATRQLALALVPFMGDRFGIEHVTIQVMEAPFTEHCLRVE